MPRNTALPLDMSLQHLTGEVYHTMLTRPTQVASFLHFYIRAGSE